MKRKSSMENYDFGDDEDKENWQNGFDRNNRRLSLDGETLFYFKQGLQQIFL